MTKTLFLSMIIASVLLTPLAITSASLPLVQTAYAYDHLTEVYHDVGADGSWHSSLEANEIEYFSFELTEPRDTQYVTVQVLSPIDASVEVYVDGEEVGIATVHPQYFVVSLTAGSHEVAISNESDTPVEYFLYLGHVNFNISCSFLSVDPCALIGNLLDTMTNFIIHQISDPVINAILFTLLNDIETQHNAQAGQHANEHIIISGQNVVLQATLDDPTFGLEEIKNEIIDIETNLEGTKEKVSVTVHLDQINIKKDEVLVLLDTTDSGTLSKVHVAATLPCNGGKPPTAGSSNDTPNVNIVAGEATGTLSGLIDAASDDTGFVGPMKTCVFHDTLTAAGAGHPITDVILINPGNPQEFPSGTVVTITGTYT